MAFDIFTTINMTFNTAFAPILVLNPLVAMFIISTFLTVLVLVINRIFINAKTVRQIKEKMEEIREQMTAAQKAGNNDEAKKFLDEMMKTNSEYMKHSFKALIVSLVIISIFLPWVKTRYQGIPVARLPFALPFIGTSIDWFIWYVLISFTVGWVLKKILALDYF